MYLNSIENRTHGLLGTEDTTGEINYPNIRFLTIAFLVDMYASALADHGRVARFVRFLRMENTSICSYINILLFFCIYKNAR